MYIRGSHVSDLCLFLLSSYEIWESIGFTSEKKNQFERFTPYYTLKTCLEQTKNFRLSRAAAVSVKFVPHIQPPP
jgi:hypothetical protein